MAKLKKSLTGQTVIESKPKKTYQGQSNNTKLSAKSNGRHKKRYRGQGK